MDMMGYGVLFHEVEEIRGGYDGKTIHKRE